MADQLVVAYTDGGRVAEVVNVVHEFVSVADAIADDTGPVVHAVDARDE